MFERVKILALLALIVFLLLNYALLKSHIDLSYKNSRHNTDAKIVYKTKDQYSQPSITHVLSMYKIPKRIEVKLGSLIMNNYIYSEKASQQAQKEVGYQCWRKRINIITDDSFLTYSGGPRKVC
jgi:hypothetical protein